MWPAEWNCLSPDECVRCSGACGALRPDEAVCLHNRFTCLCKSSDDQPVCIHEKIMKDAISSSARIPKTDRKILAEQKFQENSPSRRSLHRRKTKKISHSERRRWNNTRYLNEKSEETKHLLNDNDENRKNESEELNWNIRLQGDRPSKSSSDDSSSSSSSSDSSTSDSSSSDSSSSDSSSSDNNSYKSCTNGFENARYKDGITTNCSNIDDSSSSYTSSSDDSSSSTSASSDYSWWQQYELLCDSTKSETPTKTRDSGYMSNTSPITENSQSFPQTEN